MPADWDTHEDDKARRNKAREKNRKKLRSCLDAVSATTYEARKPTYEWKVTCTLSRKDDKGRMRTTTEERQVVAQNAKDAWAMFCDLIGTWPAPGYCDREIVKLEQRLPDHGDES